MMFQHWRRCSWKCFLTLCIFCISLNLLLLNIYLYFLFPLVYPKAIDCTKYRKNHEELNAKLTVKNQPNWSVVAEHSYIYSAYHSRCPPKFSSSECIQFIGIALNATESKHKPNCDFHESTTYTSSLKCGFKKQSLIFYVGAAFVELLPEGHFLPYTAAFFYCDLKTMKEVFPEYVTIYDEKPIKWFPVKKIIFKEHFQPPSLSLCVRPLYGHFSKLFLLQFLSYYSSKGVDKFIFYHHNSSQSTLEFLSYIAGASGISLSLLPWNIPLSNNEVHEYGQIVFTQDCLARSRYKYSHTIVVDLDEFLVPKEHKSLVELVTYLDAYYSYAGSFVVSNVLFCEEFQNRPNFALPAIYHDQRQKTTWAHGYRSKYIARPHTVRYGGIHSVWGLENRYREVNVPSSVALLHHYKPCCGMQQTWFMHLLSFNVLNDEVVTDDSLRKNSGLFNATLNQLIMLMLKNDTHKRNDPKKWNTFSANLDILR